VTDLDKGTHVTLTDLDGKRYERIVSAIHYPATLDGHDAVIMLLEPVPT
jgi:hypothetical protein